MRRLCLAVLLIGAFFQIVPADAQQGEPPQPEQVIDQAFLGRMRAWIANPIVALSVKAQNARYEKLAQARIGELDGQWRKEREAKEQPLISATLSSPLSIYLLRVQAVSEGAYTEIFVMDNHGLNVGQSVVTSDYWQGDEDKFQKTFDVAPDAVFIDKAEFDEKTRSWRAQVSLTLTDPETNQKIGAVTVQVNLTEMLRRAAS